MDNDFCNLCSVFCQVIVHVESIFALRLKEDDILVYTVGSTSWCLAWIDSFQLFNTNMHIKMIAEQWGIKLISIKWKFTIQIWA